MRAHKLSLFVLVFLFGLSCMSCGVTGSQSGVSSGASGGGGSSAASSEDQFEVTVVRIADLEPTSRGVFSNIGADLLARGEVKVEEIGKNEVKVEVEKAAANATYQVAFCSFASGLSGCITVGSLTTDAAGNAEVELRFPRSGVFAGVFVLTRNSQNQFVTGFTLPSSVELSDGSKDVFEVDLQRVSAVSGGLAPGFGATGDDPLAAGRVEVEEQNEVEVKVTGAVASVVYSVSFCRFGVGPSGCVSVGSFMTNTQGNAEAKLHFPLTGTFDGVFLLTRSVSGQTKNEFVTGFRIL